MREDKRAGGAASDTKQASDKEAGAWNIPYARAQFEEGIQTDSVGEMGAAPEPAARRRPR